jgi:hypothetical protein
MPRTSTVSWTEFVELVVVDGNETFILRLANGGALLPLMSM